MFFEELGSALVNLLGLGMFIVIYYVGGSADEFISDAVNRFSDKHHLNCNGTAVNLICKGVVVLVSGIVCISAMPSFAEVMDVIMPIGDFSDISAEFSENSDRWLFNTLVNIIIEQFALSALYFIPFVFVDIVISLLQKFLCAREEKTSFWKTAIVYITDLIMLYAVNALVLRTGLLFPYLLNNLLETYRFSSGLGYLIAMLIPMVLLLFSVMRNLVNSDMLMAILGVNITAAVMQISVHDGNRMYLFAIALGCSIVAKLIKSRIVSYDERFKTDAIAAALTVVGTSLVSWLLFRL